MPRNGTTISELLLEQYALGELAPEQERTVREELEASAELRARLAAITDSSRQILSDYPPERVVPAIRERMRSAGVADERTPRRARTLAWAVPVAAMAMILVSFFVIRDETRLKGLAPHLGVFLKTAAGAEEIRSGAAARQGDLLQLSYAAGGANYGVILSVDGRGAITWHLPAGYDGGSETAAPLSPQGQVVLPSAYELDDAPGFERFFLVYSTSPFAVRDVERAAQALARRLSTADREALGLPRGLGQFSLLVKKTG